MVPEWFYEPLDYTICNLPILTINTFGEEIVAEPRIPAHLGIINNNGENSLYDDFNGYDGSITIERRGNSSQWQPKPPYRFETVNEDGSNSNVSLLGMPDENDWVLDPVAGAGTTGHSCTELKRNCTLIDKNRDSFEIMIKRIEKLSSPE